MSRSWAACAARTRLAVSPLDVSTSSTSPAAPSARTCAANTSANSPRRATAVSVAASALSDSAGNSGRGRSRPPTSSVVMYCASAPEAPLPQTSTLPPPVTQASSACSASITGRARVCAHW